MSQPASLDEHFAELRLCRLCLTAGYQITPGPVFSSGTNPQVMLIGQAPGITEGLVKRPFNAGSGRRLFQWLEAAGWEEAAFRSGHTMTAVTKCYPGPSVNGKGDRVPSRAEQALCRPWLEWEMRLVDPRLIILVGTLAIKLFFNSKARLNDIVGSGLFIPPDLTGSLLHIEPSQAQIITTPDDVRRAPAGGRFVVPLPHPSGVSLWPNHPENQALIQAAIDLLDAIRVKHDL